MVVPIRWRITLWYVFLLTVVVIGLSAFLLLRLQAGLLHGLDEGLATRAAQISLGLENGCEGEFQDVSDASLTGLPLGESGAQLVGADGSVKEWSGDQAAEQPLIDGATLQAVLAGENYRGSVTSGPDAERFRVLAVALPSGRCHGVIAVATSYDQVSRSIRQLWLLLVAAGPAVILLSAVGGWWLTGRALSPVARLTREAEAIGVERLDARVDVPAAQDELRQLALTLNSMLDRLARGLEDRRRFVADASHELRTPLAVMRSELDVSLRDRGLTPEARLTLESTVQEVERMRAIVENLLTLARADDGRLELLKEDVDLTQVADAAVETAAPLARAAGVAITVDGPPLHARLDRLRIQQVLGNLLSNAIRYAPRGSEVRIEIWRREDGAGFTVSDHGPGVSESVATRVFDRFVRGDAARTNDGGSGLGLAISREIVRAHGGEIWVDASPRGASFSFVLPGPEPHLVPTDPIGRPG
jgi:two-component system, OmpR family, sensor kinase